MKGILFAKCALCLLLLPLAANAVSKGDLTKNNGAVVYDVIYNNKGDFEGIRPGLWALDIKDFNEKGGKAHEITELMTYGGEMKMYCQGNGNSSPTTPCSRGTLEVGVNTSSVTAYDKVLTDTMAKKLLITPVIEANIGGPYLKNFNQLNTSTAIAFADTIARLYCANNRVSGLIFYFKDAIDVSQPGQSTFFSQIAKDLAGKNMPTGPDPYNCVNQDHPVGRKFALVTDASHLNTRVGEIISAYANGYIIDRLADMNNGKNEPTHPDLYKVLVKAEVEAMLERARDFHVMYQFAVPMTATANEYEYKGKQGSGYNMNAYMRGALQAIDESNARNDVLFLGIDLVSWRTRKFFEGIEYFPAEPSTEMLSFLQLHL